MSNKPKKNTETVEPVPSPRKRKATAPKTQSEAVTPANKNENVTPVTPNEAKPTTHKRKGTTSKNQSEVVTSVPNNEDTTPITPNETKPITRKRKGTTSKTQSKAVTTVSNNEETTPVTPNEAKPTTRKRKGTTKTQSEAVTPATKNENVTPVTPNETKPTTRKRKGTTSTTQSKAVIPAPNNEDVTAGTLNESTTPINEDTTATPTDETSNPAANNTSKATKKKGKKKDKEMKDAPDHFHPLFINTWAVSIDMVAFFFYLPKEDVALDEDGIPNILNKLRCEDMAIVSNVRRMTNAKKQKREEFRAKHNVSLTYGGVSVTLAISCQKEQQKCRMEFNPNKCFLNSEATRDIHTLLARSVPFASLKYPEYIYRDTFHFLTFDVAIDMDTPMYEFVYEKDRRKVTTIQSKKTQKPETVYFGIRECTICFVKMYDKEEEAILRKPWTRLELTLDRELWGDAERIKKNLPIICRVKHESNIEYSPLKGTARELLELLLGRPAQERIERINHCGRGFKKKLSPYINASFVPIEIDTDLVVRAIQDMMEYLYLLSRPLPAVIYPSILPSET